VAPHWGRLADVERRYGRLSEQFKALAEELARLQEEAARRGFAVG
jgi:hypothetical protein